MLRTRRRANSNVYTLLPSARIGTEISRKKSLTRSAQRSIWCVVWKPVKMRCVSVRRASVDRSSWFAPVAFSPVLYFTRADLGGVEVSGAAPVATPLDWYDTK